MNFRYAAATAVLLFTSILQANSQVKREILEDDPSLAPNFRVELSPFIMYSGEQSPFAGWGVRVAHRFNNQFSLSGEFMRAYYDSHLDKNVSHEFTLMPETPKLGSAIELLGTYYFGKKEKEVKEWLPIKSESVGYRTVEVTVDPMPVSRLALYGVRLGFNSMRNTSLLYDVKLVNINDANDVPGNTSVYSEVKSNTLVLGLNATRIKNVKVRYPAHGTRRKQFIREYYLDLLYAPSISVGDVYTSAGGTMQGYSATPEIDPMKIGGRIGLFSSFTGRIINFGFGLEVATYPGSQTFRDGLGFNVRFVFSYFGKMGVTE